MKKIAITGNICTGKTFILKVLKTLGQATFSADDTIRNVIYNKKAVVAKIAKHFPSSIDSKGKIDRKKLAAIIFYNNNKKDKLEKIIYPLLNELRKKAVYKTSMIGQSKLFFEIPLLFEKKLEKQFDKVILIMCSTKTQKARALKRKGMNKDKLFKILNFQIKDLQKIRDVDFTINTNLGKFETVLKTKKILKKI